MKHTFVTVTSDQFWSLSQSGGRTRVLAWHINPLLGPGREGLHCAWRRSWGYDYNQLPVLRLADIGVNFPSD